MNTMLVLPCQKEDLVELVAIHQACFKRGAHSSELRRTLLNCYWQAYPMYQVFVAKNEQGVISGYIVWREEGGFRAEANFELKQLGVAPKYRRQGVAQALIEQSLERIKTYLQQRGSALKNILVTTGAEHSAQALYQRTLGAHVEAVIKDYFSGDEVIMVARI